MLLSALSVRVVFALQVNALLTLILPALEVVPLATVFPLEPVAVAFWVEMVTLPALSAVAIVLASVLPRV